MPWIETQTGRYERPLDSMERFHKAYGAIGHGFDREHFSLSAAIRFESRSAPNNIVAALQHAWKSVRYRWPQIAAFVKNDTLVYEVPKGAALDSWLATTFVMEPESQTTSSLQAAFKPQALASLHYLPHSSEILFHTAHWRIDGVGTLLFFDWFFEALANPVSVTFGAEHENLAPSLDEIVQAPKETTAEMEQRSTVLLMQFLTNLPSIGLAPASDQAPAATRRLEIELEPHTTSAIIANCRAQAISVTAGIHAAVVCATQQMADPARSSTTYTTFTFFDLRKHLPPKYQGKDCALSVGHVGLPASFQPSTFSANARELKDIYARPVFAGEGGLFHDWPCYVDKVTDMISQPPPQGALPATEGNFSSLGLLDKYLKASYGDYEIRDFWLGVEMLTAIPMVHAWTRQGRLKVNLSYNETFFTPEVAQTFLAEVVGVLVESLGA